MTSDGEASQIVIKDGEAGAAPAIGVKLDSDGKYYWTLDGEFITEGGKKMPVTGDDGVTPVFKIENDTWYVSYDKEATWKECGPATGAAGDSFFSDVSTSEDGRWVYLTLADGETVLTLEMYKEFGIAFESLPELIMAGATAEIPFVLTGADDKSVVEAIAKGDWEAEAVMDGTEGRQDRRDGSGREFDGPRDRAAERRRVEDDHEDADLRVGRDERHDAVAGGCGGRRNGQLRAGNRSGLRGGDSRRCQGVALLRRDPRLASGDADLLGEGQRDDGGAAGEDRTHQFGCRRRDAAGLPEGESRIRRRSSSRSM